MHDKEPNLAWQGTEHCTLRNRTLHVGTGVDMTRNRTLHGKERNLACCGADRDMLEPMRTYQRTVDACKGTDHFLLLLLLTCRGVEKYMERLIPMAAGESESVMMYL